MTTDITVTQTAPEIRHQIRNNRLVRPTAGLAPSHVQANLAILPREYAFDFLLFCQRNPKPCPIIEVLEPGEVEVKSTAPNSDIRTDIPLYRIYESGILTEEVTDIKKYWRNDLVSFLLGCSFSFETAMVDAGIPLRHQQTGNNVAMYITNIATTPAGTFSGPMVVSMRPIKRDQVVRAVQVTSRFPATHGAPVHIGTPQDIGITHIDRPDFGDPVEIKDDEEPVFWACGVTPQAVALNCKPPLMITHAPGRMFITDQRDADYAVL